MLARRRRSKLFGWMVRSGFLEPPTESHRSDHTRRELGNL